MKQLLDFLRATILLVVFPGFACTQPFTDVASASYHYHFPRPYVESQYFEERNVHFRQAEVLLPLKIGIETYLLVGGQHSSIGLGFYKDMWYSELFRITDFKAGIFFPWQNDNHKTLVLSFTRWGEQEGHFLESDNFQIGGIALHSYQVNQRLALKAGLFYNHEFFGHYFVPLGGIDWRIKDDLWLYGTLPANLQLHKQFSRSFGLSASYLSQGGSMKFNEEPGYLRVGQGFPPYGILGIDLHLTVLGPATLKASLGHSISRNYGKYSVDDVKETTGIYADYKDGLVFRMSLIARVFEKKER